MIEENLIKPKTKIGLSLFLNSLNKWRSDLVKKKINHVKINIFPDGGISRFRIFGKKI